MASEPLKQVHSGPHLPRAGVATRLMASEPLKRLLCGANPGRVQVATRLMASEPLKLPQALGLALVCLLRYAQAARHFPDKGALVMYLDWIYKADLLAPTWRAAEARAVGRLRRHTPTPIAFPFLTP